MESREISCYRIVSKVGTYILFVKFLSSFSSVKNVAVFASEVDRDNIRDRAARQKFASPVMRSEVGQ